MARRLVKFARLGATGQLVLLHAFLIVATIRLALWILPFRVVRRIVSKAARPIPRRRSTPAPSLAFITAAVGIVSRYVPAATCLTQALAAQILLARSGHRSSLRIGVLRKDGRFKAHAWVEYKGTVVIGNVAGMDDFSRLPAL